MVAREKSKWFGCMLAASLFGLVLAGCGDVSESGSSQRAQPSKKIKPTETAESHAAAGGEPANHKPTQPDMLGPFYEPGAPVRMSVGSGYVLSGAVLAAEECKPIPNARIEFWLANPIGETTTTHTGLRCSPAREEVIAWRAMCPSPTAEGHPTSASE
jgi:protocatechuate 3,4-dioxygenase beta subunit